MTIQTDTWATMLTILGVYVRCNGHRWTVLHVGLPRHEQVTPRNPGRVVKT